MILKPQRFLLFIIYTFSTLVSIGQFRAKEINWTADGNATLIIRNGEIVKTDLTNFSETTLVKKTQLIPAGEVNPLTLNDYAFSADYKWLLIFTNTAKVWR